MRSGRVGKALTAVMLTVTGCSQALQGAQPAPSPSGPAAIWGPCQGGGAALPALECGVLTVPLDHDNPQGETIPIALLRIKATGDRLGSLVFNFGGPGGSGVQGLFGHYLNGSVEELNRRFDLVSFDPRGVGASTPVMCLDNAGDEAFLMLDHTPDTDEQIQAYADGVRAYTAGCEANTTNLLPHMGTVDVARDMETLRTALGEEKLNFFGISYGTWLGAVYAHLFPDRVGRTVLDSAVDPSLSPRDLDIQQAQAIEANLRALLGVCVSEGAACPLQPYGDSADELYVAVAGLSDQLDKQPMTTGSRTLSQQMFLLGLGSAVGAASARDTVTQALADGLAGDPAGLIALADNATGRQPDGSYSNLDEVNRMVRCADTTDHYGVADVQSQVGDFGAAAPIFGIGAAWDGLRCLDWPYAGDDAAKDVAAPGSATTIVVVGSAGDPETPYAWSPALASQLGNADLITNNGPYHGAYFSGAECVQEHVNAYLFDGTQPGNVTC